MARAGAQPPACCLQRIETFLADLKLFLDDALQLAIEAIGLDEDLSAELIGNLTVRYRAIRYAPIDRDVAGIGLHPDGNVLSALITDGEGLIVQAPGGVLRRRPRAPS